MYKKKMEQLFFQDEEFKGEVRVLYDEGIASGFIESSEGDSIGGVRFGASDPEGLTAIGRKLIEIAALVSGRLKSDVVIR